MKNRFVAKKFGLLDFWHYDEQEYELSDGKIIFRGTNGSGKSVTTQSFIPLLLDGNKSPNRIDPFGTKSRRLENYLLMDDDQDEKTSYLYLEFFKEDTNTYITVGMGMRIRRGRDLESWYFILKDGHRVGIDFKLYKETDEKYLLTSKELKSKLGAGNFYTTAQGEYMKKVNEHLYGYSNIGDYKDLLNLLIELRSPKLSKEFKPTKMYEILNKALGTLGEDDLLEVSEAMDNMEELQMRIKNSEEALASSKKIEKVYDEYNRVIIYNKAKEYFDKNAELIDMKQIYDNTKDEIEVLSKKVEEINIELFNLEREHIEAKSVEESLKENNVVVVKAKLMELKNEINELTIKISAKENKKADSIAKEVKLREKIANNELEEINLEKELEELVEEEKELAEEIYFSHNIDFEKNIKEMNLNIESFRHTFEDYHKLVEEVYGVILRYEHLKKDLEEYESVYYKVENKFNASKKKVQDAREYLTSIKTEYSESINSYFDKTKELKISKDEKIAIHKKVNDIEAIDECYSLADYIKKCTDIREYYDLNIMENEFKAKEVEKLIAEKLEEIDNLKLENTVQKEDLEEFKEFLDKERIEYIELFKCIDFSESLSLKEKQRLESSLNELSYLHALVIPRVYKEKIKDMKNDMNYKYIIANENAKKDNLLEFFKIENNEFTKKYKDEIIDILKGISLSDDEFRISATKAYKLASLSGELSNEYELKYIGYQSRVDYIDSLKRKIQLEIDIQAENLSEINKVLEEIKSRKVVFILEFEGIPKLSDIEKCIELIKESESIFMAVENEFIAAKNTMKAKSQAFEVIKAELFDKKNYLRIPSTLESYDEVKKEIFTYRANLNKIDQRYNKFREIKKSLKYNKEDITELNELIEEQMGEIAEFISEKEEKSIKAVSFEERLKEINVSEIEEKLEKALNVINSFMKKQTILVESKGMTSASLNNRKIKLSDIEQKIILLTDEENFVRDIFKEEKNLGYINEIVELDIFDSAKLILDEYQERLLGRVDEVYRKLLIAITANRGSLVDYNLMEKSIFVDEDIDYKSEFKNKVIRSKTRIDIFLTLDGRRKNIKDFNMILEKANEDLGVLINKEEKNVLENTLIKTLSTKISGKIYNAKKWVSEINKLMNGLNTSSGLKLKLLWEAKRSEGEEEISVNELYKYLNEADFMSDKDRSKVANHFKAMLKKEKRIAYDKGEDSSYKTIIKDVLDYRKWFDFKLEFSIDNNAKYKELTDNAFFRLSGGEKAMSMYIPLFAAVNSRYSRAEKKDCPRIIALDEAFAGVDDDNIREMFSLLESLNLDYVLNSQVLWGTYDSVESLAIYEIIRYDEEVIVPIKYEWNGKVKTVIGS
ncbi:MAG: TIGR02680 family protein [Sarcina sp.]